jgi:hypothetical protein
VRPERPRDPFGPAFEYLGCEVLAAFQAAGKGCLFTQGIGLRPQPWAGFSRPVGPVEARKKPGSTWILGPNFTS